LPQKFPLKIAQRGDFRPNFAIFWEKVKKRLLREKPETALGIKSITNETNTVA
jgi:hypothetical protein